MGPLGLCDCMKLFSLKPKSNCRIEKSAPTTTHPNPRQEACAPREVARRCGARNGTIVIIVTATHSGLTRLNTDCRISRSRKSRARRHFIRSTTRWPQLITAKATTCKHVLEKLIAITKSGLFTFAGATIRANISSLHRWVGKIAVGDDPEVGKNLSHAISSANDRDDSIHVFCTNYISIYIYRHTYIHMYT